MKSSILLVFALLASAVVTPVLGQWSVDNDDSRLSFISIKAGSVAEVHHFERLQGSLGGSGQFELSIDLTSVETMIPIRNERMQEMLFNTSTYPEATLTSTLDLAAIKALSAGEQIEIAAEAQLDLVGKSTPLTVEAVVARLSDDRLLVTSKQPLTLNADNLGLGEGVNALREVAGLSSISPAVPVSFRLTLVAGSEQSTTSY